MPERNQKKQRLIGLLNQYSPQAVVPPAAEPPPRATKPNKPHRISVRGKGNIVVFGDYVTINPLAEPEEPEEPEPPAPPPPAAPGQARQNGPALIDHGLVPPQDPRLTLDAQEKGDEPLKSESSPVISTIEVCNIKCKYGYSVTLLLQKCVKSDLIQKTAKYLMISIACVMFIRPNYSFALCNIDRYPTDMADLLA